MTIADTAFPCNCRGEEDLEMADAIAKYEQIVRWARWSGITAALTFGSLYLIDEARNPTLYFVSFVAFLMAAFALIGISLYQWKYKRKHGIHHHG